VFRLFSVWPLIVLDHAEEQWFSTLAYFEEALKKAFLTDHLYISLLWQGYA